jgi:hypothetical protein
MSLKKYNITITKFIDSNDLEFEEKKIIDILKPDSYSIKEEKEFLYTLDNFLHDHTQEWSKLSENYWSKKKGNFHFDIYQINESWSWKVKINNAGIDYTVIERGVSDSLIDAMKKCNNAYINQAKRF